MKPADTLAHPPQATSEPPRACLWTVDREGKVYCIVRRDLHAAVVRSTKRPGHTVAHANARREAFLAANRELAAHHCEPIPVGPVEAVSGKPAHAVAGPGTSAGPVTRFDTDRLHQECIDAAISWGMRMERRAHPDTPLSLNADINEASRRMADAHAAYHRAMDRLTHTGATYEPL